MPSVSRGVRWCRKPRSGATVTSEKQDASFAFIEKGGVVPGLGVFSQGTQEYPDRSTTLMLQVESLAGDGPLRLSGPGIAGTTRLHAGPLAAGFVAELAQNRKRFPQGVDLLLCCGRQIAGLPRSTKVEG